MMTKEQHIKYWIDTVEYDWVGVDVALKGGRYA